jgi:hypothetical protein
VSSTYVVAVGTVIFGEHLPGAEWKLSLRILGFVGVVVSVLILANPRSTSRAEMPMVEDPFVLPAPVEAQGIPTQPIE